MNRRHFITCLTAGVLVPGWDREGLASGEIQALGRPLLCDMLGPSRVCELGMEYRRMTPRENSVKSLSAAIRPGKSQSLKPVIQEDFATGRTIIVKGWVLSVTEARQCALFSLLCS